MGWVAASRRPSLARLRVPGRRSSAGPGGVAPQVRQRPFRTIGCVVARVPSPTWPPGPARVRCGCEAVGLPIGPVRDPDLRGWVPYDRYGYRSVRTDRRGAAVMGPGGWSGSKPGNGQEKAGSGGRGWRVGDPEPGRSGGATPLSIFRRSPCAFHGPVRTGDRITAIMNPRSVRSRGPCSWRGCCRIIAARRSHDHRKRATHCTRAAQGPLSTIMGWLAASHRPVPRAIRQQPLDHQKPRPRMDLGPVIGVRSPEAGPLRWDRYSSTPYSRAQFARLVSAGIAAR
jgi:hypothetical protein